MLYLKLAQLPRKVRALVCLALFSALLVLPFVRGSRRVQAVDERAAQTITSSFLAQPIPSARNNHSATLLPNGKILVAGGTTNGQTNGTIGSSFLYDTSTGQWTEVGNLRQPRYGHFAVLLPSGKVLIGGGLNATGTEENSVELFDLATNRWEFTGFLNQARYAATATLLSGTSSPRKGMVLITGGKNRDTTLNTAELFDPVTARWEPISNFQVGRWLHTATQLADGKVLVTGGSSQGSTNRTIPIGVSQLYDPVTNSWSTVGDLITPRINFSATLLSNGQVLVTGGATDVTRLEQTELYDPATQRWTNTGRLARSRERHSATLLPDGRVVVAGGLSGQGGNAEEIVEVYDPASKTWTAQATSLIQGRGTHTATLLPDGRILLIAGTSANDESTALLSTEILAPAGTATWTATSANLLFKRRAHTATLLANGKVLLAGGYGDSDALVARAELFDPVVGTFTVTGQLVTPRAEHSATLLPNGKVLLAGGVGANGVLATGELFDPASGQWTAVAGAMANARVEHSATLLSNGKVLLAGGSANRSTALVACDLFDATNNTWATAGVMNQARRGHTATLLYDGRVVAAGGAPTSSNSTAQANSEVYNAASNSWANAGALNVGRYEHTATLLANGKVLVVSGKRGSNLAQPNNLSGSAELFDPSRLTWEPISAPQGRADHTATLLFNGQVLLAGGYTVSASSGVTVSVKQTELYDPLRGSTLPFNITTPITQERDGHTATRLLNGKVLIAGGQLQTRDNVILATSAELFDFTLNALPDAAPVIEEIQPWSGPGNAVCLRGSRLQGVSEASTGLWQSSASNLPLVRLWRVDNEQVYPLSPDPNSTSCFGARGWSNTSYSSLPVVATAQPSATGNLLPGPTLLTVTTNAISSAQAIFIAPVGTTDNPNTIPRTDINGRVFTVTNNGYEANLELRTLADEVVDTKSSSVQPGSNGAYTFKDVPAAAPPVIIAQFQPTQITAGSPSTRLTLNVSGLQACGQLAGCNVILFNGVTLPTSQLNQTVLVADVPASLLTTPGPAVVRARTLVPGTPVLPILSGPVTINIVAPQPPVINSLAPSSAQAGSSLNEIAINGSNLLDSGTRVLWNGATRSFLPSRSSATQLIFTPLSSDLAQAGSATVQVVTNSGTSNSVTFTITAAPLPVISSLSPASATVGTVLSEILINGSNLTGSNGPTVFWNNTARTVTRASSTQVGFALQSGDLAQVGTAAVRIVTSAGASNTVTFTISASTAAPVITSISPTQSSAQLPFVQESSVTSLTLIVNGRNFASDALVLVEGGVLAVTSRSSTQITATLPYAASALGTPNSNRTLYTVNVSVANPAAATVSNSLPFAFQQKPTDSGGAVLLFPFYSSDTRNLTRHDTLITLQNQNDTRFPVYVRLLWVNGATGSVNSTGFVYLEPLEAKTIYASRVRPDETGYLIAVASAANGCPAGSDRNTVRGSARILQPDGQTGLYAADLGAYVIVASLPATCSSASSATLNFDGSTFDRLPHQLIAGNIPSRIEGSRTDANSTLFVVNAVGGNLTSRASSLGSLTGLLYSADLTPYSFAISTTASQFFSALGGSFPRVVTSYDQILPAGKRGLLSIIPNTTGSPALVSATLNLNRVNNQTTAQMLRPLSVKTASISYAVTPFSGAGLSGAPIEQTVLGQAADPTAQSAPATPPAAAGELTTHSITGSNPEATGLLTARHPYANDPLIPASFVELVQQQNVPVIYKIVPTSATPGLDISYFPPDGLFQTGSGTVQFSAAQTRRVPAQANVTQFCANAVRTNQISGKITFPSGGSEVADGWINFELTNALRQDCNLPKFIRSPLSKAMNTFDSSTAKDATDKPVGASGLAPGAKYRVAPSSSNYNFKSNSQGEAFVELDFPDENKTRSFRNQEFTATEIVTCTTPAATISFTPPEVCAGGTGYSASVANAGAGASYEWTISGGTLTSSPPFSNVVTFSADSSNSASVTLAVKVRVPPSCEASGSLVIPLKAAPTAAASAESATLCQALAGSTEFRLRGNLSNASAVWTIVERTGDINGTFANANAADTSFNVTGTGQIKVRLTARGLGGCDTREATSDLSLTVNPRPLFETTSLPDGTRGLAYEQVLRVAKVSNPSFSSANLPPGLALSANGVLSGTLLEAGNFSFRVVATANACATEQTYTLTVNDCPSVTALNPLSGLANTNVTLTGTGLEAVTTVRFTGNVAANIVTKTATQIVVTVPSGAQSGPLTLVKPGCPDTLTSNFTVQACPAITLSPTTLPTLTVGAFFNQQFSASGNGNDYSFTVTGTLPTGLQLSSSGLLSGTPTQINTFTFTIMAVANVTNCAGQQSYTVAVTCPTISVTAPSVNTAAPGRPFSQTFSQTGGLGNTTWSISNGVLPNGLTLNPNSGVLSGTTQQTGSFPLTVRATDANGCAGSVNFTLTVTCPTININPPEMPTGTAGQAFTVLLSQAGGTEPIAWTVSAGALPTGLSLNQATGVLSGTPTAAGKFDFSIRATDANGCAGTRDYSLTTNPPTCQTITINPATLANGAVGTAYTAQFTQSGGTGALTWSISAGSLPPGLSLNSSSGSLSGTPSAPGASRFTVQVTDVNNCSGTRQYEVTMSCSFAVNPTSLELPASGGSNSVSVQAAAGCAWTAASNVSWLAITSSLSDNGNGNVNFTALGNSGAARTGTLTIAGQTVTVTQAGVATNIAVVSAASYTSNQPLAPDSIIAIFGTELATTISTALSLPLPTALAGTTVRFRDSAGNESLAPLFFVAPSQVNCLVPTRLATGTATITITAGNGKLSTGTINIGQVGPGLFSANANGQGVPAGVLFRIAANGTQTIEPLSQFTNGQQVAIPINLGPVGEQVFLILFGTGIRGRSSLSNVIANLGGTPLPVSFADAQGTLAGLDQLNLGPLSRSLQGRGTLNLNILVEGQAANVLQITLQ